jgi:4-amino-4-deoxy-L-arabinose transferase-like glycosyltransferase
LLDRVWFARILSVIIGSLSIPVGFWLCRKVFQNDAIAIGISAFIVVMPEFAFNLSRVSNECLSAAIYTTLFLAVCHWIDQPESLVRAITVGALLGLGLLTKAYFLTAVPALCVLQFWLCMTQPKKRSLFLKSATTIFVISGAISGWWYVRNILQTGTVSGLDEALLLRGVGTGEKLLAVVHVQWVRAIATVLLAHLVWGWSLLSVSRFIYYAGFVHYGCDFRFA